MALKFAFDKHTKNRTSYNVILSDLNLVLHVQIFGQKLLPCEERLVQNTISKHTSLGSFPFPPGYNVVLQTLPFNVFLISFPANGPNIQSSYALMPSSPRHPKEAQPSSRP